jgi:predicted GNAT family acetyltransferase
MKAELIESVDEFITATTTFRGADPLRTNIIGSVALAVSTRRTTYDECRWWVVRDEEGVVAGVAMRTSPFNMVVSPMPGDAARALGRRVGEFDDDLPGITGSRDVVESLLDGYVVSKSVGSTRTLSEHRRELLYELEDLVVPDVDGTGRPARETENEPLARMVSAFLDEAGLPAVAPNDARDGVARSTKAGSLFCWEVDGEVVAIAGHAPVVTTGATLLGRVGPVYTPPENRRRGYGSAVTAHVSTALIEKGARVMLFTDAANPTSNSIYQSIGYRLVDELFEMRFEGS